jgi:hypothetical protein
MVSLGDCRAEQVAEPDLKELILAFGEMLTKAA